MSYVHETHLLARALAKLMARGSSAITPDEPTMKAAAAARNTVLELLTRVHRDLTGIDPAKVPTNVGMIERAPEALLGRLLADHPRVDPNAIHAQATPGRRGPGTAPLWEAVRQHAARAAEAWRSADPATRPQGAYAWTAMADLAAVTSAVATLDRPLATCLRSTGNHTVGQAIEQTAGLTATASQVQARARMGDLPPLHDAAMRPRAAGVMQVRDSAQITDAERQLASLLKNADGITPAQIGMIAYAQARTAEAAAGVLDVRDPMLANRLRDHSRILHDVAQYSTQVATAGRGEAADPAVYQATSISNATTGWTPRAQGPIDTDGYYRAYYTAVPEVTQALCAAAEKAYNEGRYFVPDPAAPGQGWIRPTQHMHPPVMLQALRHAAHHASTFAQGTGTTLAGLAMGHLPTPRDTLKATTSQYKRPDLAPPPAARPLNRPQPPRHQP